MPERTWTIRSGQDLGRALAEIRRLRGLTQAELAASAGLARPYLAKLEAGNTVQLVERTLRALRRLGATITISVGSDGA